MNVSIDTMGLQTGDLILCTGRGLTSRTLQLGQGILHDTVIAPYSHAAITLASGYLLEAVYDKGVWVNCLFDDRTEIEQHRFKTIVPFRPWQHGYTKFHVYRHPDFAPINDDEKRRFIEIAMRYYGEDYASKFHFLNLLHHRMQDALKIRQILKARSASRRERVSIGESFCSELASKVYAEFGIAVQQKHMPAPVALRREGWAFQRVQNMEIVDTDIHPITSIDKSLPAWNAWNLARLTLRAQSGLVSAHQTGASVDRVIMEQIRNLSRALGQDHMDPIAGLKECYINRGRKVADQVAQFGGRMTYLFAQLNVELGGIARIQAT